LEAEINAKMGIICALIRPVFKKGNLK